MIKELIYGGFVKSALDARQGLGVPKIKFQPEQNVMQRPQQPMPQQPAPQQPMPQQPMPQPQAANTAVQRQQLSAMPQGGRPPVGLPGPTGPMPGASPTPGQVAPVQQLPAGVQGQQQPPAVGGGQFPPLDQFGTDLISGIKGLFGGQPAEPGAAGAPAGEPTPTPPPAQASDQTQQAQPTAPPQQAPPQPPGPQQPPTQPQPPGQPAQESSPQQMAQMLMTEPPELMQPEQLQQLQSQFDNEIWPAWQKATESANPDARQIVFKQYEPQITQYAGQLALKEAGQKAAEAGHDNVHQAYGEMMQQMYDKNFDAADMPRFFDKVVGEQAERIAAQTGRPVEEVKAELMQNPQVQEEVKGMWENMDGWQIGGVLMGGGIAILGLLNMLFNGGGIGSLLMVLGGGALALSSGNFFGEGGNVASMFGNMFGGGGQQQAGAEQQQQQPPQLAEGELMPVLAENLPEARQQFREFGGGYGAPILRGVRNLPLIGGGVDQYARDYARQLLIDKAVEKAMTEYNIGPEAAKEFATQFVENNPEQVDMFIDQVIQ